MVRRSLHVPPGGVAGRTASRSTGLGPRGRGIFERLFGGPGKDRDGVQKPPRNEACTVAVASGKGGTGKSFLATSLAVALHRERRRVTLVDCDFGLACDHLLLGVTPKRTLQHVLAGQCSLRDVRLTTPSGPSLIPGGQGVRQMADLTDAELLVLGQKLGELAATEDVILLDIGAGIAPQTVLTLLCADHVVLVTQPEIAALTDAYAVVKCLRQLKENVTFSVIVNRVMASGQGELSFERLAGVAQRYSGVELHYLGEIGENPMVTQRRLGQQPLVVSDPDGDTARSIQEILRRLRKVAGPLMPRLVESENGIEARFREHRLFL